jgi:general secretion pathway protein G
MENKMKTQKQKKAGFTLVELMVVAIIVAILAAVAIPMMSGNKNRAMATEAEAGIGSIQTVLRVYRVENDAYPTAAEGTAVSDLTGIGASDMDGQYFDTSDYTYQAGGSNYVIKCTGTATSGQGDGEGDANGLSVSFTSEGVWTRSY